MLASVNKKLLSFGAIFNTALTIIATGRIFLSDKKAVAGLLRVGKRVS